MLEIKNLSSYYGESRIIPSLSMSVPKGEIVCLVGRNGVGKSTTLKSIMGMVKTPEGSILLDGTEIIGKKTYERAALGIGYVPQGREIFPQLTVAENLELGLQVNGGKGEIGEEIFELFPIIKTFMNRKGGNLSGGQQQQLAIARALVSHPKLLILDEPTEGIQPSIIEDIASAIERVNKELGITILIVEQYLDFVLSVSNRYYVMDKGEITLSGYKALCYARERQAFGDGELARGRNQIRVIRAIIDKVKSNSASILMNYSDILDTLAGTFETDLTSDQMSDLIKVALNSMNDWDIKSYSAWGGSGKGKVASMGSQEVYFIFPNSRSVEFTKELFHTILNNELITDEQLSNAPGAY